MNACGRSPKSHVGSVRGGGSTIRRMMLVVVAAMVLSAIVPALAGAHITWATNYIPVSKSTAMEWTGKLRVSNPSPEDNSSLECSDTAQGSIGANGAGEITKITTSGCKNIKGCGSPSTMTALNLPWHTELVSEGGVLKNVLSNGGKGNPGFKTECTVIVKNSRTMHGVQYLEHNCQK